MSAIHCLESWRQLLIGTPGGEFRMGSENSRAGPTPTNVLVRRESNSGVADAMPRVIGGPEIRATARRSLAQVAICAAPRG